MLSNSFPMSATKYISPESAKECPKTGALILTLGRFLFYMLYVIHL